MKKILVSLLVLTMAFSLVACGGGSTSDPSGNDTSAVTTTEAPTEAPTEPPKATIGNVTVAYDSAVMYKPYDSEATKPNLLVYLNFTNNSDEAVKPSQYVYTVAKQGDKKASTITYMEDAIPPEMSLFYKEVAPGETVKFAESYSVDMEGGEVTIEYIDLYNQIDEKLVFSLDPANLELITESLAVPEAETTAE